MAEDTKALVPADKAPVFNLAAMDADLGGTIAEEMDGLGSIPFEIIKVPGGGHIAFEVAGDDENNPDVVKELVGIIVHQHAVNAYWEEDGAGSRGDDKRNAPTCSSLDGHTGFAPAEGVYRDCGTCDYNKFGTAGRGKACKNMRRLYFLMEGRAMPVIIQIPPTSLKAFKDYVGMWIARKQIPPYAHVTKLTLKKETSPEGKDYSKVIFSHVSTLSTEDVEKVLVIKRMCSERTQETRAEAAAPVVTDAQDAGQKKAPPVVDANGFMEIPDTDLEELPFN